MMITIQDAPQTQSLLPKKSKEMLSLEKLPNGKLQVKVNFSSLSLIHDCMRKAQYALVEKWKNDTESEATVFGSAIHKALEHWYSLSQDKRELSKADAELASTFTGEVGAAQTGALESIRLFAQAAQPLRWLGDDDKRSIANGIKILKNYFKHYLNDGLEVVCDADGNPLVEKLLEAVLHEDDEVRIIFFGTIDAIMQDTISKQFVVCDHKTTAALGAQFYNRINRSHTRGKAQTMFTVLQGSQCVL